MGLYISKAVAEKNERGAPRTQKEYRSSTRKVYGGKEDANGNKQKETEVKGKRGGGEKGESEKLKTECLLRHCQENQN